MTPNNKKKDYNNEKLSVGTFIQNSKSEQKKKINHTLCPLNALFIVINCVFFIIFTLLTYV